MKNISVEGNNLIKKVGFDLEFEADITYEEFCAHPEYQEIFEEIPSSIFTLKGFGTGWGINQLKTYELIMQDFMTNTYIETFINMLQPNTLEKNDYISITEMKQLQKGLPYNESRIEFDTLIAKYYLNNNKFYHQDVSDGKESILSEALVLTPAMNNRIKKSTNSSINEERKEYSSMIGFSQTRVTHMLGKYLLFISILTDIDLYVIININEQKYSIITYDNIKKYIGYPFFLCCSIKKIIEVSISYESKELITSVKSKYGFKENSYRKFIEDIFDLTCKDASVKIKFELRNKIPQFLDFNIRDQNLDKYNELKEYKRGESGVTRTTAIEEHGSIKTAVVSTGKIKYK